jgi:hypothetical protein
MKVNSEEEQDEILKSLGLTKLGISERSSEFPMFIAKKALHKEDIVPMNLVEFVKSFYTYNKLVYYSLTHLVEKSSKIMEDPMAQHLLKEWGRANRNK